jgi:hypothetical protein
LLRKEGLEDQGDKRMEQRKDSRIRRSMWKKEQNKKNETERFQDQAEVLQKDARIRGSKEWSREKIPGSGGC